MAAGRYRPSIVSMLANKVAELEKGRSAPRGVEGRSLSKPTAGMRTGDEPRRELESPVDESLILVHSLLA
jgi:hypothetical protein